MMSEPEQTAPATTMTPAAPASGNTAMQGTAETGEHFNGYTLMVEAYAAIWLILMGWLLLIWRKSATLTARVDGLEAALDRAEKRLATESKKPVKAQAAAEPADKAAN